MEDLSLFDFDYLRPRASKCETNHFHIILEGDLKWPFCLNDNKMKGLFMHEYIHYVQHLSTLCGISLSRNFNLMFVEYRDYFESNDIIQLPICLQESNERINSFYKYFNDIKGTRIYNNRFDKVDYFPANIETADKEKKSVPIIAYNEEIGEWDKLNVIEVGYYVIVESMADMIQRIYDPGVEHDAVPYLTVQKICEKELPGIESDYRKMVAICICALMYSNPGVGLFEAIIFAKRHPMLNGYYLYRQFVRDTVIHLKEGNITIKDMFAKQLFEFKNTLDLVFGGQLDYYGKVIDNAMIGAETGNNMLLALLYDDSIPSNEYICRLADFYGYPYIEAYDLTLWPGNKSRAIDAAVAVGFELLYKRFVNRSSTECPRSEICKRQGKYAYECKYDQWHHQEPCPFTGAIHYFNLNGKSFEQET